MTDRPNIEALAQWLDTKFARHGEIEDKQAAEAIRALAAQAAAVPQGWREVLESTRDVLDTITTSETFFRDPRGDKAGPAIDAIDALLSAAPPAPAPVEPLKWPWRDAYVDENLPASPAPVAMPNVGEIEVRGVTYASVTWHSIVEAVKQRDVQWQAQVDALMRERDEERESARQIGEQADQLDEACERMENELAALRSAPTDTKPLTGARIQKIWAEIAIGRDEPFVLKIDEFARAIYAIHAQTGAQPLTYFGVVCIDGSIDYEIDPAKLPVDTPVYYGTPAADGNRLETPPDSSTSADGEVTR